MDILNITEKKHKLTNRSNNTNTTVTNQLPALISTTPVKSESALKLKACSHTRVKVIWFSMESWLKR